MELRRYMLTICPDQFFERIHPVPVGRCQYALSTLLNGACPVADVLATVYLAVLASNSFALSVVPITTFFSIVFGTVVFLRSEKLIRKAVNRVVNSTLRLIEAEVGTLFNREASITQSRWRQLARPRGLRAAPAFRS
jgi:hypothetical protein